MSEQGASSKTSGSRAVHNLVACGATEPDAEADGAMFSDFMSISSSLMLLEPEAKGTFLSCFPLKEHFDFLSKRTPPITDIKWGERGSKRKPIFIYQKSRYDLRPHKVWYQAFPYVKDQFYIEVVGRIWKKVREAQPGDVVNLFFQCHGTPQGTTLGHKLLANKELAALLKRFREGAQVNAVDSHCNFGKLVEAIRNDQQQSRYIVAAAGSDQFHFTATRSISNRFRNFRLSQPFMQSLTQAKLPGLRESNSRPLTVEEHNALMETEMSKPQRTMLHGTTRMLQPVSLQL